jgi:hypothetical protein
MKNALPGKWEGKAMHELKWCLLGSTLVLGACSTPFAQSARLDMTAYQANASIALSQPKVYRREALMNERARDLTWIDDLIDKSATANFTPDVIREVEQITAIAAAVGLNLDPAAGANFQRATETADLQQDINVLRLKFQMEQLQHDANLLRAKFASDKDTVVNEDLGKAPAGTVGAPTNQVAPPAVAQLAELNTLITGLRARLDAPGTRPMTTNVTSSPADVFRDRSAYRDMLKAARNAASLDEMHDFGDRSLVRLNFQATILPNPKYDRSLSSLSVTVAPQQPTPADINRFYGNWLHYLTSVLNKPGQTTLPGSLAETNDMFSTLYLETGTAGNCRGWFGGSDPTANAGCSVLAFALPRFSGSDADPKKSYSAADLLETFDGLPDQHPLRQLQSRLAVPNPNEVIGGPFCTGDPAKQDMAVLDAVRGSLNGLALFKYLDAEILHLPNSNTLLAQMQQTPKIKEQTGKHHAMTDFIGRLERAADANCGLLRRQLEASRLPEGRMVVPQKFSATVTEASTQKVRVYEVAPREQAQQVSTLARAATAVQLGASLAAAKPGSGMAANAGAAFGRQAMGRAETLERLPMVVGFAAASGSHFGWAIGPKATVDPKGKIRLQHGVKPIDLSVDMSVPAFTSRLRLEISRQWGPDAARLANAQAAAQVNSMDVELRPQQGDLQRLTLRLLQPRLADDYAVRIDGQPVGPAISACRPTTLWIAGPNIWRTSAALVRGQYLDSKAIVVGPGMDGIFLTVPALVPSEDDPVNENRIKLLLFSPYGQPAEANLVYSRDKVGDACKPRKDTETTDPTATGVSPSSVTIPARLTIRVTGTNLKLVDRATIGGVKAEIAKADVKGNWLDLSLSKDDSEQLNASPDAQIELFVDGKSKANTRLAIIR